jgi:hypothetical protein
MSILFQIYQFCLFACRDLETPTARTLTTSSAFASTFVSIPQSLYEQDLIAVDSF